MLDTETELQSDNIREMKEMMEQVGTSRWRGKEEVVEEEGEEEEKKKKKKGVIKGTRKEDDGFDDPDRARAHALRKELAGGRKLKEIMQQFQEQLKLAEADAAEGKDFPDDFDFSS
jgi:transcriptional regulator with AAA-type ATPase domain